MATKPAQSTLQAGQDWLLSCTRNPTAACRAWAANEFARIASGEHWRIAEGPLLQSVRTMKRVGSQRLGPVLADTSTDRIWWLLPPDLSAELDHVSQLTVHPPGWPLPCPPVLHAIDERMWLERPDGSGRLTNPAALGVAFGLSGRLPADEPG
ncbi:hypothetical protein [Streptomyces dysideae]|uniref:Uncharacterized protein n=1 Tax=Streptomyces dysideae TaxID=909626 RepID=A0A117RWJ9_9ACTN|nr:hypothetical protein [Streptomyces dysideae]KUO13069.1 hypothetical protein AQJ91_47825 [Streptomyces dysideae]